MNKNGLTLVETLLTGVLLWILLAGIFELSGSQRKTVNLMQNNNFALFALESIKNKALHYNENSKLENELNDSFFGQILNKNKWQVNLNLKDRTLLIEMFRNSNKKHTRRRYIKKVVLPDE